MRDAVLRGRQVALGAGALAALGCGAPAPPAAILVVPEIGSAAPPPASARPEPPRARQAAPPIVWETAEPAARERARRSGLPMIVFACAAWTTACLEMDRKAWQDPRVREGARGFVALRLDLTSAEGDAELYAQRYGIDRLPTTILFDPRGHRVSALTGYLEADALAPELARAAE